jgi:membrane-associated PAP2 superfamily phosphatase
MVRALDRPAGRYPGICFIAGHAGGDFNAMERCMEVIRSHGSIYADTAA